jgi:hypothetical protein
MPSFQYFREPSPFPSLSNLKRAFKVSEQHPFRVVYVNACAGGTSLCASTEEHTQKNRFVDLCFCAFSRVFFFVCILLFLHQHFVLLSGADGLLSVGHNAKIATWLWRAHSGTPSLKKTVVDACVRRRVVLHRPRFTALAEIQSVGRQKKKKKQNEGRERRVWQNTDDFACLATL